MGTRGNQGRIIHTPDPATLSETQWSDFARMWESETGQAMPDVSSLHEQSVRNFRGFWDAFLRWSEITYSGLREPVCTDDRCEHAQFFPHLKLNYAENLLRADPLRDDLIAVTSCHIDGTYEKVTRRDLRRRVLALAAALRQAGIGPEDRVVGVVHNNTAAVVGALAAAAIGATFSSASPEMGSTVILSRFAQLAPKALLAHALPAGEPERVNLGQKAGEIAAGLTTLTTYVAMDHGPIPEKFSGTILRLPEIEAAARSGDDEPWVRFPFNHPLFILFSSGTSGLPKCIIHGAGGTLLEHQKEQRLHGDLTPDDTLFCHSSTAWMVWNWQLSALACSPIVLFDGPVTGPDTLWRIVAEHDVTVFGTSPAYLKLCEDSGFSPNREFSLAHLRAVQSRGSILYDRQYDWAREHVGDIPLQSISGGTDIIGCFVSGCPNLPVYRGESQCRSLAMDVQALRPAGKPGNGGVGELICRNPFPSRPLGFFGDADGSRFHAAYFSQNPGVWTHGDLIEFTASGGARMHGRSDSIMKVSGIRVGPAEIYRILESMPQLTAAMAVEQRTPHAANQSRMVLLIVPQASSRGDPKLKIDICKALAAKGSRAHVPDLIVEVDELPLTFNGKPSERAARDALNAVRAANVEALKNPGSLDHIRERVAQEDERIEAAFAPDSAPVAEKLRSIWERTLGLRGVDADDSFFDLGGTSLMSAQLCQEINDQLGVTIGPWILFQAPTLRSLTVALACPDAGLSPIVPLKAAGTGRPVFMIPGMYGDAMELRALASELSCDRPLYGLRARGLAPGEQSPRRVEDIAGDYLTHIRALQPRGPYALVGYSFGGLVAFEMACQLEHAGETVEFLGLIDTRVHAKCLPRRERLSFWKERGASICRAFMTAPLTELPFMLLRNSPLRNHRLAARNRREQALPPLLQHISRSSLRAYAQYRPRRYSGHLAFFHATKPDPERVVRHCDPRPIWDRLARVEVRDLPGTHGELITEPLVRELGRHLASFLEPRQHNAAA